MDRSSVVLLLASDLRAFLDALGLERVALIGHSMGANVAGRFAQATPERVVRLVVEDTVPPAGGQRVPEVPASPPEPVDYDWQVRRQIMRELGTPDSAWDAIADVSAPTLLVAGADERPDLTRAVELLPAGRLVTVPVGHWIHETDCDAFVEQVGPFLEAEPASD